MTNTRICRATPSTNDQFSVNPVSSTPAKLAIAEKVVLPAFGVVQKRSKLPAVMNRAPFTVTPLTPLSAHQNPPW